VLELLTTLAAFRVGAFEVNPLVARLTLLFGGLRGVLISKLIAVLIAMGVRRRLWLLNVLYTVVYCGGPLELCRSSDSFSKSTLDKTNYRSIRARA
jgi:hypothetical protein